jgi:hypothetical protein
MKIINLVILLVFLISCSAHDNEVDLPDCDIAKPNGSSFFKTNELHDEFDLDA